MTWFIRTINSAIVQLIDRYHPSWLEGPTTLAVNWTTDIGTSTYFWIYVSVAAGISAVVLTLTLQSFTRRMIVASFQHPLRRLALGITVLITVPLISYLLVCTTIGIPLAALLLSALAFYLVLAGFYGGMVIGAGIFRLVGKDKSFQGNWKSALIGAIVGALITSIPYVGWVIGALVYCWVLGTFTTMKFDALK